METSFSREKEKNFSAKQVPKIIDVIGCISRKEALFDKGEKQATEIVGGVGIVSVVQDEESNRFMALRGKDDDAMFVNKRRKLWVIKNNQNALMV